MKSGGFCSEVLREKLYCGRKADIIEKTMDSYNVKYDYSINDLVEADRWAAETADALIKAKEN